MAEKTDNNSRQVQNEDENSDTPSSSSSEQNSIETSSDNSQDSDPSMKRAPLSRASTLESIQEDSELEEKLMIESFKSITDVFEKEEEVISSKKSSPPASPMTSSKSTSFGISEDTDSLDEEVRQIMLRSEEKQTHEATNDVAINSLRNNVAVNDEPKITKAEKESFAEKVQEEEEEEEEEEVLEDDEDTDDYESESESSVPTDTESISESEQESEVELPSGDEKTGHWSLRKDDDESSSDDDDFDLEEHINKLCSHTINSDSSSESEGSDSEAEKQKVVNKVMRMYAKKYSYDNEEDESESDKDDDSDMEETDLEEDGSDDGIEEVEVKDDEDSSEYSASDDDTYSDFLDDDSASISTASSTNGDYDVEELDHEKDAKQGINEEIPYLSDPSVPSHEVVYKYYLGTRPESCPEKIEVQDGDLNNNIALDNTLATRSVINLRWPFTSYYVKEFDLDSETPTYEEDGLLPCYKSMKSSASFPGRRRDVMLGRVWWVEWWAKDAVKDEGEEEEEVNNDDTTSTLKKEEHFEDVEEGGKLEKENIDTQL